MENILPLSPGLGQGKLTTLRGENRKHSTRKRKLKKQRTAPKGVGT
jgi:hypothetical protein